MVADELAISLATRFVPPMAKVLDPFCGSGRLLAAADKASLRVGIDANPLAYLLTRAKFAQPPSKSIRAIVDGVDEARLCKYEADISPIAHRKVEWFSKGVARELSRLVSWLNTLNLSEDELLLVASALSATVRDVSYARDQGWKLHRLSAEERQKFKPCPWSRFKKRLIYCCNELSIKTPSKVGKTVVALADSRALGKNDANVLLGYGSFDVVLTSPPYGDSRSTVQYGAASALCLSVVSQLNGLASFNMSGGAIDSTCLGGLTIEEDPWFNLKKYWAGSRSSSYARAVSKFLSDYTTVCTALAARIKPRGHAIFIVGRRSTGGFRLKLDDFTVDCFARHGFKLVCKEERPLMHKRIPNRINRFARSKQKNNLASALVPTMGSEIIVVVQKK